MKEQQGPQTIAQLHGWVPTCTLTRMNSIASLTVDSATDPLDLSLSLPLIQNGSVLTALLVLLYIYFLYLEPLLCLSLPHFSTAATIMSL